jgi:urease accessory protein
MITNIARHLKQACARRTSALQATCQLLDGGTVLTERYHEAPLKLTKTFREESTSALKLYLMDVSPGLMDGDRYEATFHLGEHSHLIVTNQSFTKVHPTPLHGAELDYQFDLREGAILEYFPEPTIPYALSRLHSCTHFRLAAGASLLYADILTPGRLHRDELFQYTSLSMQTEVYRNNQLIAWDHFRLDPASDHYNAIGALEHFTHHGTFWILAEHADSQLLALIRALLPTGPSAPVLSAASLLADQGIVVRMLGFSAWELQSLIQLIWAQCRNYLWKFPPCHLRK